MEDFIAMQSDITTLSDENFEEVWGITKSDAIELIEVSLEAAQAEAMQVLETMDHKGKTFTVIEVD